MLVWASGSGLLAVGLGLGVVAGLGMGMGMVTADTGVDDDEDEMEAEHNATGYALGSPCEDHCDPQLAHVVCDLESARCQCDHSYPVKLARRRGCGKPAHLGDQCFYYETCAYYDQFSECRQIKHNAICSCQHGYHEVTVSRPAKRVFCSKDVMVVSTDRSTLLGVATGLAIFSALICFVLKLFVGDQPRHYGNASLEPQILFTSDTGLPLAVHGIRPGSRASSERSVGSGHGRASRGIVVPASRAGAARAAAILLISCHLEPEAQQGSRVLSLASVHSASSNSNSTRSFSARRYEREKEQRLAVQAKRAHDMTRTTPSPRSTDQLITTEHEQPTHELSEWPSKSSDNILDVSDGVTSEAELFPSLSSSLPAYSHSQPLAEWPKENL